MGLVGRALLGLKYCYCTGNSVILLKSSIYEQERKQSHFVKSRKEFGAHLCSDVSQLGEVEVKSGETLFEGNMGVGSKVGRWRRRWRLRCR